MVQKQKVGLVINMEMAFSPEGAPERLILPETAPAEDGLDILLHAQQRSPTTAESIKVAMYNLGFSNPSAQVS